MHSILITYKLPCILHQHAYAQIHYQESRIKSIQPSHPQTQTSNFRCAFRTTSKFEVRASPVPSPRFATFKHHILNFEFVPCALALHPQAFNSSSHRGQNPSGISISKFKLCAVRSCRFWPQYISNFFKPASATRVVLLP